MVRSDGSSLDLTRVEKAPEVRQLGHRHPRALNTTEWNMEASTDSDDRLPISGLQVNILLSPEPYPHWTIRECYEQPEAIARALAFGGTRFARIETHPSALITHAARTLY